MSCDPFDMIDCPAAATWRVKASGLVVGGGEANGVSVDAAADDPA